MNVEESFYCFYNYIKNWKLIMIFMISLYLIIILSISVFRIINSELRVIKVGIKYYLSKNC